MGEPTTWAPGPRDAITDVPGIKVGHWTDRRAATGCTVILSEAGALAAVDVRGGAPGTRETDVLAGPNLVRMAHAVLLTGGSAFGLAAADGVMRWLSEHGHGFPTAARAVPIVPSAVLYDLALGKPTAPDAESGYRAAVRARSGNVEQGSVGAGTGATVAKLLGPDRVIKGGLGTASLTTPRGVIVGAIAANNASGYITDPTTGATIAACRDDAPGRFVPLPAALERRTAEMQTALQNTTLVCVATNARLDHHHLQRVAYQAQDGLARAITTAHTSGDGDVAFALSTATHDITPGEILTVGVLAARAVEIAIQRSITHATSLHGVPTAAEWAARA